MAVEIESTGPIKLNFVDRALIKQCVHCGLCLSACPTYKILGSELDSPRGRVFQTRAVQEGRVSLTDENYRLHIDRCLNCRACETACPSGVQYGQILEAARAALPPASRTEALIKWFVFGKVFTSPTMLNLMGLSTRLYQKTGLQRIVRASGILEKLPGHLGKLEALLPPIQDGILKTPVLPAVLPPRGTKRGRVALLTGCVQDQFFHRTNVATARVLALNGYEVAVPGDQVCCGALHTHGGEQEMARELARRNIAMFEQTGAEVYIINAAGCGSTLKEYNHLLAGDPAWAGRARAFSAKVRDINEFLASIDLNRDFGEIRKRVTYQDACHLAHGQRITLQPRELIQAIPGIELIEMNEADTCCGSAGIYNVTQYDLSMQLLDRKLDNLEATGVEMLVASNPGCIIQLMHGIKERGLPIEVIHPVDLLDQAYQKAGAT